MSSSFGSTSSFSPGGSFDSSAGKIAKIKKQRQTDQQRYDKLAKKADPSVLKSIINAGGNTLGEVLKVIDLPRAAIVGSIAHATGQSDTGRSLGYDITHHIGTGDFKAVKNLDNKWQKRAIGFVGDVALDPTTYLTLGAAKASSEAVKAGTKVTQLGEVAGKSLTKKQILKDIARPEITDAFTRPVAEELAEAVNRKSLGLLDAATKSELGIETGITWGLKNHKIFIPTSGELTNSVIRATESFAKMPGVSWVAGGASKLKNGLHSVVGAVFDPQLEKAVLKAEKETGRKVTTLERYALKNTQEASRRVALELAATKGNELAEMWKKHQGVDPKELAHVIQTPPVQRIGFSQELQAAAGDFNQWMDDYLKRATDAGMPVGEIPNYSYLPWQHTPEWKAYMESQGVKEARGRIGKGKVAAQKKREAGNKIYGFKNPGTTEAEKFAYANDLSRQMPEVEGVLGVKKGKVVTTRDGAKSAEGLTEIQMFKDNPWEIAQIYMHGMSRAITQSNWIKQIAEHPALAESGLVKTIVRRGGPDGLNALERSGKKALRTGTQIEKLVTQMEKGNGPPKTLSDVIETTRSQQERLHGKFSDIAAEVTNDPDVLDSRLLEIDDEIAKVQLRITGANNKEQRLLEYRAEGLEDVKSLYGEAQRRLELGDQQLSQVAIFEALAKKSYVELGLESQAAKSNIASNLGHALGVRVTNRNNAKEMAEMQMKKLLTIDGTDFGTAVGDTKYVPDWLPEVMKNYNEALRPDNPTGFIKMYDKVTNLWKAQALLSPGFHVRNYQGGLFNNALAGVSLKAYLTDLRWYRLEKRYKGEIEKVVAALPKNEQPWYREWKKAQAVGKHNGGRDVGDIGGVTDLAKSRYSKFNPLSQQFGPYQKNYKAAGWTEDRLRGPLFVHEMMINGGQADKALDQVIKFHFDYSDLNTLETKYLKRIVPFYTWTRKNFPLQIENMIKQPGKYTRWTNLQRNMLNTTEEDPNQPSYYSSLFPIQTGLYQRKNTGGIGGFFNSLIPTTENTGAPITATPDLPFANLAETLDPLKWASQLNPIIKTPMEQGLGVKTFTQAPFSDKYQPISGVTAQLLKLPGSGIGTKILAELPFAPTFKKTKQGQWVAKERDIAKIEAGMPLLSRMNRLYPNDPKSQTRAFSAWSSFMFGVGSQTNDERSQSGELNRRIRTLQSVNRNQKILDGTE